ncbi:MAG: hypothetical protein OET90_03940 [Desulfuromonadales bacterium]|nr:hypothetical protein [Desulfuromonadales bacterium]
MFQWDKSVKSLDVTANDVVHLFRSMREVQIALPGFPAQQASAYLCQYTLDNGICTAAVFHLHKSGILAFYFDDPRVVPISKTDKLFDRGLNFVETMGFLLTDQDIHLLDAADQEMLWASLPLAKGLKVEEKVAPAAAPAEVKAAPKAETKATPKVTPKAAPKTEAKAAPKAEPVKPKVQDKIAAKQSAAPEAPAKATPPKEAPVATAQKSAAAAPDSESAENVDDLLAAVEAMRAKRPGLRARKRSVPTPEELENRRLQLRENVGRILASL